MPPEGHSNKRYTGFSETSNLNTKMEQNISEVGSKNILDPQVDFKVDFGNAK